MDTQTQAQLYLADQRGCSQIDYFRSLHSFNFGQYVAESRTPFGSLHVLNDDLVKAGHSVSMQVEVNTEVIIIPIVGGLEYKSDVGNGFLEAGQLQIFSLTTGMGYEIINPYETEFINYIAIWQTNKSPDFLPGSQQLTFDLQTKNKLLPLVDTTNRELSKPPIFRGFIGRYDGRHDGVYQAKTAENYLKSTGVFVFILNGAFEVQNRLLHERDGLALMDILHGEVDFEALSNDAILLLMEISMS